MFNKNPFIKSTVNIFLLIFLTCCLFLLPWISFNTASALAPDSSSFDSHSSAEKIATEWYLPVNVRDRQSLESVQLTTIGDFGMLRKARPGIPAHLHTGIDLKRPNQNYYAELVFPVAVGKVISIRDDGPYAQIIIQHKLPNARYIWTVYEHIAGIQVRINQDVDPFRPIARFMTADELNRYGWQFDHVHLEILKIQPSARPPEKAQPFLRYGTFALDCHNLSELEERYFSPLEFFSLKWKNEP
jgi:hypothetical protein